MTGLERKVFRFSVLVGSVLTLGVLLCDAMGGLGGLERWLYDRRMADCQFFRKAPTTQIVHIDIDDASLDIHRWPWPRDMTARVLQEITTAGAKAIGTDILYSEPVDIVGREQPDKSTKFVDEDKIMAETFARMGNMVLGASLQLAPPRSVSALDSAMRAELTENLELTQQQLESRLRIRGFGADEVRAKVADEFFFPARRAAMADRIRQELLRQPASIDDLLAQKRLLPTTDVSIDSPLLRLVKDQYPKVQAWLAMSKFALPLQNGISPPLATDPNALPLAEFGRAARTCGFTDDSLTEQIVRSMPMFVECEGRVFAQWGLQFACVVADADINRAVITDSSVTIPSPTGDYVIPLHAQYSINSGRRVPYMADIPWWGTSDWRTMYDWPKYTTTTNHVPIVIVWDICQTREHIRTNNRAIDEAAEDLLVSKSDKFGLDPAVWKKYVATNPSADDVDARKKIIAASMQTIDDSGLTSLIGATEKDVPENAREPWALIQRATKAMNNAMKSNGELVTQLASQKQVLSSLVKGKGVLIGSTATGMDLVSTPLHARCPGVVVHGAIANALLTRQWWRTAPFWITAILTILLGLSISLATSYLSPINAVFTAITTLVVYFGINGLIVYDWGHWILGAAGPMVAIALAWSGATVTRLIVEGLERIKVERERAVFEHEMELAKNVQQKLLPTEMPTIGGIEPFGWTKAADQTGGDLFDLWTLPDGRLGILVADASGHGLAPSVIVSQVRTLVRALSEIEKHPNGLLARVNARLAQDLEPARFVTAFLGFMDSQGRLDWASAGHGPMLWNAKDGDEYISLDATALPLGIMEDYMGDDIGPLQLEVGGMLIVTSDGIFEAPNHTDEQFGIERVIETLKQHSGKPTLEISNAIREAVTKWQRDPDRPVDDQTTVIIRRIAAGLDVTIVTENLTAAV